MNHLRGPELWFAWHPVWLSDEQRWTWLQWTSRRLTEMDFPWGSVTGYTYWRA